MAAVYEAVYSAGNCGIVGDCANATATTTQSTTTIAETIFIPQLYSVLKLTNSEISLLI